jgi:hypothetical protein
MWCVAIFCPLARARLSWLLLALLATHASLHGELDPRVVGIVAKAQALSAKTGRAPCSRSIRCCFRHSLYVPVLLTAFSDFTVSQGSLLRGMSLKIKRKMKSAATMLELAGMG